VKVIGVNITAFTSKKGFIISFKLLIFNPLIYSVSVSSLKLTTGILSLETLPPAANILCISIVSRFSLVKRSGVYNEAKVFFLIRLFRRILKFLFF
jgi:hypothetical protein